MRVLQFETVDIIGNCPVESSVKRIRWPRLFIARHWGHLVDELRAACQPRITIDKNGDLTCIQHHKFTSPEHADSDHRHKHKEKRTHRRSEKVEKKLEKQERVDKTDGKLEKGEKTEKIEKVEKPKEFKTEKPDVIKVVKLEKSDKLEKSKEIKTDKTEKHKTRDRKSKFEKLEKTKEVKQEQSEKPDKSKERKLEKDITKDKRTKELSQDRMKQSTSLDKIKKDTHKKDTHKTKRDKFAKRHSDDRLLNKAIRVDNDITGSSSKQSEVKHSTLSDKKRFREAKPPNILVWADSSEGRRNTVHVLRQVLRSDMYTVYEASVGPGSAANLETEDGQLPCALAVVCGVVSDTTLIDRLLRHLIRGGRMLCLCSDLLNSVLPTFTTAEVREHELVTFSYGRWHNVRLMHHIFCYQASPAKKHFSQDSDQGGNSSGGGGSPVAPSRTPSSVELRRGGESHIVNVQVLGTEETWHTPSILAANVRGTTGCAVFSQVHLETDPTSYDTDEIRCAALRESDRARIEILTDILSNQLGMECQQQDSENTIEYTPAYLIGTNNLKQQLLVKLSPELVDGVLRLPQLSLQFCGKDIVPSQASNSFLPILTHSCPEYFSTVRYFEELRSEKIGRLLIYADILTSSMAVLGSGVRLEHGLAVVPRCQTKGHGRGGNVWLSPEGCGMFSVQLHVDTGSVLFSSLSLVQHLVATAVVHAIRSLPGHEQLDIGLKWPNDVYAYSRVKIGGVVVNSCLEGDVAVCNIGFGVNLNNARPTTCLKSVLEGARLPPLTLEKFLAISFTELERLFDCVQKEGVDNFLQLYYRYWLHGDSVITVRAAEGETLHDVLVTGIDQYGYLTVRSEDGSTSSVRPDDNTFDLLQGLIAPKIR